MILPTSRRIRTQELRQRRSKTQITYTRSYQTPKNRSRTSTWKRQGYRSRQRRPRIQNRKSQPKHRQRRKISLELLFHAQSREVVGIGDTASSHGARGTPPAAEGG